MSYVLRYLLSLSQSRRGVQTKMVKAIVCYADDFTVYGYFSQLTKALKKATRWSKSTLGLDVKPAWQIYHISSFEEEKEFHRMRQGGSHKRTQGVDMMGFAYPETVFESCRRFGTLRIYPMVASLQNYGVQRVDKVQQQPGLLH